MSETTSDLLLHYHCFGLECPMQEMDSDGNRRYLIVLDEDSYKWGSVYDNMGSEVYHHVRKPDEPCSHICSLLGCPVRDAIMDGWN